MLWLFVIGLILGAVVGRIWRHYTHWGRRGVPGPIPLPFFGNAKPWSFSITDLYVAAYKSYPDRPYCGIYEYTNHRLIMRDPVLIQKILVRDFHHFTDRSTIEPDITVDPLDNGLFMMKGLKWRTLRARLTPAFTSGKLKAMFPQMVDCAEEAASGLQGQVDVRSLARCISSDVIASCVFGLDLQGSNPAVAAKFKEMTSKVFSLTYTRSLGYLLLSNWPWAAALLGFSFTDKDVLRYFKRVFVETIAQRRFSGDRRNDLIQLLIELSERGYIEYQAAREPDDEYLGLNPDRPQRGTIELTDDLLVAQAFSFLSAGVETVTNTVSFTLHELARNQQLQDQVRGEIFASLERHGGLSYQGVAELKLLEMCLKETMRKYPATKHLLRVCTAEYDLDENLRLETGDCLVIPLSGIHNDPANFDNPEEYRPERFREAPAAGTYIPFGDGPRICLGMRFALVEMKVALVCLLHKYQLNQDPEGKVRLNRWSFFSVPTHAMNVNFRDIHLQQCQFCPEGKLIVTEAN